MKTLHRHQTNQEFSNIHNSLPANLLSYFKKVNGSHNHNTRNNNLNFKVRYRRTTKKALRICVKGSKMWNSLSPDIKLSRNVNAFKKMFQQLLNCHVNLWQYWHYAYVIVCLFHCLILLYYPVYITALMCNVIMLTCCFCCWNKFNSIQYRL